MNVLDRKLFNRGARDELRRRGGINDTVNYANGGGVLSNIFNYFRTPDEQNPMLQMIENAINPSASVPDEPRISDELMQYLASQRPRLQGGAVPGGSFPTNTIYDPDPDPEPQIPVSPTYDMTQFVKPKNYDDIGDAIAAEKGPTSDEGIRARVAESALRGKSAAEIADAIGRPIKEVLDVGIGFIGSGILEGTAFGLDVLSALESGVVGNRAGGEMLAKGARNVKGFSDETFYRPGDSLPRVSSIFPEDATEQERRDAIRRESLANIADAQDKQILTGLDTGVFADTGESIPAFSTRDRLGQGVTRVDGTEIAPKADELNPAILVGDSTFPVGEQGNRPDVSFEYESAPDSIRQGVVSALSDLVNEPPADMPQTTKQKISEALVDIGAGGIERIGGTIDEGIEFLKGLISKEDAPTDERYVPELTTQAGRPGEDPSVVEELTTTAGELTSKLTKKAQDAINAAKNKLDNPESEEEIPNIENNESTTKVQLDDKTKNEPILTDNAAKVLTNNDDEASKIIQNITKGDVGNMKDDLYNVTDDESFESYVSKYVKQYQELFKEDEDQIAKDKGFALAIFGSVYGSTGDWAQASAAMIDMLRGDKATRQARKDKVKMLAINTAADRVAADLKYKRDIEIAKTRGSNSFYGKRTEPLTQTYRLAENFLNAGDFDTYDEAFEAAKKQVEREYGISLGATADIEKPDPKIQEIIQNLRDNNVSDDDIKKQLEDAAKANNKTIDLTIYGF